MKSNIMTIGLEKVLTSMVKEKISDKKIINAIVKEYKAVLERASDIGSSNRLLSSYVLAAYFIAMNRSTGLSAEENLEILKSGMEKSKLLKMFMGNADGYFDEKNMESRRQWSEETHKRKYKNDWVVDVIEKTPDFQFGFNYLECGVCKLCRDEHCPELAKYMCSLDFMLVEIIGIELKRTKTLAEGGDFCDFRFIKK